MKLQTSKKKKKTKNKFYNIPSDYSALLEFFPVHHEDKKELSREMEWSQKKHKSSCEHFFPSESESEVAQLCPTLCYPVDCSPPGSSIHGIFQARVLKWVAISFSRGSSQRGIKPWSPALQADTLPSAPPRNLIVDVPIYIFTKSF